MFEVLRACAKQKRLSVLLGFLSHHLNSIFSNLSFYYEDEHTGLVPDFTPLLSLSDVGMLLSSKANTLCVLSIHVTPLSYHIPPISQMNN